MIKLHQLVAALCVLPMAAAASASLPSLNLVSDFGTSAFSYGAGSFSSGTPTFTAFTQSYTNCFNVTGFDCTTSGPAGDVSGSSNLPGIGVADGAIHFLTVDVSAGTLWAHPANGGGQSDIVVRFKAAADGDYTLNGLFSRLDNMTSGSNDPGNNGVSVAIYKSVAGTTSQIYSSALLSGAGVLQNTQATYDVSATLGSGDYLYYVVGNNGNYYNDSTGLLGTISYQPSHQAVAAVPEPASWAMMLGGFGLIGGALRSRRKSVVSFS